MMMMGLKKMGQKSILLLSEPSDDRWDRAHNTLKANISEERSSYMQTFQQFFDQIEIS